MDDLSRKQDTCTDEQVSYEDAVEDDLRLDSAETAAEVPLEEAVQNETAEIAQQTQEDAIDAACALQEESIAGAAAQDETVTDESAQGVSSETAECVQRELYADENSEGAMPCAGDETQGVAKKDILLDAVKTDAAEASEYTEAADQPMKEPEPVGDLVTQSEILNDDLGEQSAVAPDEVRESETSNFGNEAKKLLAAREDAQKEKGRLEKEAKQIEKSYTGMQRSISDSIAVASKKKKEEIAATYDKELSQYQDKLESCKMERAKAKANAIAQKIQVENAPLNQQNQELEAQIDMKFKDNQVPAICKKRGVSILFFPKEARDWVIDAAAAVILLFFVPLLFILAMRGNPLVLASVLFFYLAILFGAYLYVLHNYMLKFSHVNDEVEELRKVIRTNNKTKQTTANRIRKSQDETGYNLGAYDDKLSDLQKAMRDTVAKRQDALENFEKEVRQQISEDISAANKDELQSLQKQSEDKQRELSGKTSELSTLETQLKEKYETAFGKEWSGRQKTASLEAFADFCVEHPELSLTEAAAQYRSQKK